MIVGAIRWDAFYSKGGTYSGETIDTMSQMGGDYLGRAPVHAIVEGARVVGWGDTQATFDAEITAAKNGGLNYWAYLLYKEDHVPTLNYAWQWHQSSSIKNDMNWCLIAQEYHFGSTGNYTTAVNALKNWMLQTNYQKVLGNRPLLYIIESKSYLNEYFGGSLSNFKAAIDALRTACTNAGLGTPYIAFNGSYEDRVALGLQAEWNYAAWGGPNMFRRPYTELTNWIKNDTWPNGVVAGRKSIPILMTSWDPRPKNARPNYYDRSPEYGKKGMYVAHDERVINPTMAEWEQHVRDAKAFVAANSSGVDSQAVLCYAWSEFAEGGWLGPTRDGSGQARLAALKKALTT